MLASMAEREQTRGIYAAKLQLFCNNRAWLRKKLYLCNEYLKQTKCKHVQNNIDMANVVTTPSQGQILVNIEDMSMLKDIKKAISLLKGVGRITVPRTKRLSSYERSLRDLDEGRVYEYDSLDDLIKEIEE